MTLKRILFSGVICSAVLTRTQGEIHYFDLTGHQPGGTGLSGPISPGTGTELSPGISYDDTTHVLSLHFGWGSDPQAGSGADILGLGDAYLIAQTAEDRHRYRLSQVDYSPYSASVHTDTALQDFGAFLTIAEQEAALLSGLFQINIFSGVLAGVELTGQLTAVPEPEEYASIAALALFGFGVYRKKQQAQAVLPA